MLAAEPTALLVYEAFVIIGAVFETSVSGSLSPKVAKVLAVLTWYLKVKGKD